LIGSFAAVQLCDALALCVPEKLKLPLSLPLSMPMPMLSQAGVLNDAPFAHKRRFVVPVATGSRSFGRK